MFWLVPWVSALGPPLMTGQGRGQGRERNAIRNTTAKMLGLLPRDSRHKPTLRVCRNQSALDAWTSPRLGW